MSTEMPKLRNLRFLVRPARATDANVWFVLWRTYCAELGGEVLEAITEGVWQRILSPAKPVGCLLACRVRGDPVGFVNYVIHPRTFSLQPACHLEDIFVIPEARGNKAGHILIEGLILLGRQHGWERIYWHTREDNHAARKLYDRLATRTDYIRYDIEL